MIYITKPGIDMNSVVYFKCDNCGCEFHCTREHLNRSPIPEDSQASLGVSRYINCPNNTCMKLLSALDYKQIFP